MSVDDNVKKYESYKIPSHTQLSLHEADQPLVKKDEKDNISFESQGFAEIEIIGTGRRASADAKAIPKQSMDTKPRPASKPQAMENMWEEHRDVFAKMRQMAREYPFLRMNHSKILYQQDQRVVLSKLFYVQAVFMKDFEDQYPEQVPFSTYYPYYQIMNYEQLRTYFTWRTNVRQGRISNTSKAYAFMYIYELLNNIGVNDPEDGLNRMIAFWEAFREYDVVIDRYILRWIKDYHIYYELPQAFEAFIYEHNIQGHYPDVGREEAEAGDIFELFCGISKYDIKASSFYSGEAGSMIHDCFQFVIDRLRQRLGEADISLDNLVFKQDGHKYVWTPFNGALFYPWLQQTDRQLVFSKKEIYICRQNKWSRRTDTDGNRQFVGYIMKQMEASLRRARRFKYKLSANPNMIDSTTAQRLSAAGISLEQVINDAVSEFYAETKRKVVTVDKSALEKIRREALDTQEKLIVQDDINIPESGHTEAIMEDEIPIDEVQAEAQPLDQWASFRQSLTQTEYDALRIALQAGDMRRFSQESGMMLEVLIDSINQKAYDTIFDTVLDLDDDVTVYRDYRDKLLEMVME